MLIQQINGLFYPIKTNLTNKMRGKIGYLPRVGNVYLLNRFRFGGYNEISILGNYINIYLRPPDFERKPFVFSGWDNGRYSEAHDSKEKIMARLMAILMRNHVITNY